VWVALIIAFGDTTMALRLGPLGSSSPINGILRQPGLVDVLGIDR
jgi:hypothetical protein